MSVFATQGYTLRRAAALLGARPGRFLLGIVSTALAVTLLLVVCAVGVGAMQASRLAPGPQLNVFVALGTADGQRDGLRARLAALEGAPAVRLIPRAQALAELRERAGAAPADTGSNPLPDVLVAQYALGVDAAIVERAAAAVRGWNGVDAVESDLGWYRRLAALAGAAGIVAAVAATAAVLLALLALPAAAAQVRLTREEATVLRMAGASTGFIVRPHACAAALTLALGATLALALLAVVVSTAQPQFAAAAAALGAGFAWPRWPVPAAAAAVAVVAAVALLGWVAGWISALRAARLGTL